MNVAKSVVAVLWRPLLGLTLGLAAALICTFFAGENPGHILAILWHATFGSLYDFGQVLYYTTALIFTGLSVCIAFHAGLFNIGAEGQLTVSALAMAAVGILWPNLPAPIAILLALFAGVLAGGFWGFIPGYLRAHRGSHEVILTMMLNFVAAGIANYLIVGPLHNPESQSPETAVVGASYQWQSWDPLHALAPDSAVNFSFILAVIVAVVLWQLLRNSIWGFELRATGSNATAAKIAGISTTRMQIFAMVIAGALAGLVGMNEILGSAGKFRLGFSADFGFVGIAVALLARNNPVAIIFSAFLFGALQKGSSDLDLETAVITRDFAKIMQASIILGVAGLQYYQFKKGKKNV